MTRTTVLLCLIFVTAVALIVAWVIWEKSIPTVDILCARNADGRLVIDVKADWRVNALYSVRLWLEGDEDYLWVVRENKVPVRHLSYGTVPPGATQMYPAPGLHPRPVPNRSVLYVGVKYQYDSAIPPACLYGTSAVKFQITDDGEVGRLGRARCRTDWVESEKPLGWDDPPASPQQKD